jgi:hypothetical protein
MVTAYSEGKSMEGKPTLPFVMPPSTPDDDTNLVKVVITAPYDKVIAFKIQRGLIKCIRDDLDVDDHYHKDFVAAKAPIITPEQCRDSIAPDADEELGRVSMAQKHIHPRH